MGIRGRIPTKAKSSSPDESLCFSIRIPASDLRRIEDLAKKSGESRAMVIARMLRDGMNETDKVMELLESPKFLKSILFQYVKLKGPTSIFRLLVDVDTSLSAQKEPMHQEVIQEVKEHRFKLASDRLDLKVTENDGLIQ
jgi:hypothetical protein